MPESLVSWVLIWPAMSSLLTVSTMSKFTVPPVTLLTVTLTPSFCRLVVMVQSSVAPTVALRSSGQDTEPGFYPDCWATFELIWSATSLWPRWWRPRSTPVSARPGKCVTLIRHGIATD